MKTRKRISAALVMLLVAALTKDHFTAQAVAKESGIDRFILLGKMTR